MITLIISVLFSTAVDIDFENSDCTQCHEDVSIEESKHQFLSCMDCHTGITELPHEEIESFPSCGNCHGEEYEEHKKSIHGKAIEQGIKEAAHCWDCHGSHQIIEVSDTSSPVFPLHLPETCGECHGDPELAERYGIPIKIPYELYNQSIHHSALLKGEKAATCVDCHGVHNIKEITDPLSPIAKKNIPQTCSNCHKEEYKQYSASIHFIALERGIRESPACNDCHSEHRILPPDNPESPVYPFNIPKTCSDCHERYVILEKYGIPGLRLSTYFESFHGLALKAGNIYAANCVSCHENHLILPASDPKSSINPANLQIVCGKCHPGIQLRVPELSIHKIVGTFEERLINLVKTIYIWLIVITVGGMIFYVFLDWLYKTLHPELIGKEKHENPLKFNKGERSIHLIHLISFFILAYTGFALRYSDTFFTSWINTLMNGDVRSYLHRIFGSILVVVFIIQIFLIVFTQRGRKQIKALLPKVKDVKDAIQLFLSNLGLSAKRPEYEGFSFYEKFEYWAFIWGTILMTVTGFGLWFTSQTLKLVPKWVLDIFTVIHFYEAILATLAILVWHFYWVIFDPDVYPINRLMFSSKNKEREED